MGNCFGSCCGDNKDPEYYRRLEEEDRRQHAEARARAAQAADERQRNFDASAQGRAANKAILEARKQATKPSRDAQVVRDWNS
eukprot:CAMPEP_0118921458 /NCGR_PEP_ID=MMETSP1169-20130426/730_1 /TAXON_ID=36882 /ORGANISM="Pyramimonas obovata, Strain CCMP722" /LENGTH=82 /DNA_ID=CAMNT_0006862179 /DNA_START=218 /DNA_END=466 /DNA_ORIENTATION=+